MRRQADRLPWLCRVGVVVAAGQRSGRCPARSRPVHRGRHFRANLRRHHRARRGSSRRRRRHSRPLPPAPSRLGRGPQSRSQDRRRTARLAVAGRDDCGAPAQAQYLVRAARLVTEVSHPGSQARDFAAAQGTASYSAATTHFSPTSGWGRTGGRRVILPRHSKCFTRMPNGFWPAWTSWTSD